MRTLLVILTFSFFLGCLPKDGGWSNFGESPHALSVVDAPLSVCSYLDGNQHEMLKEAVKAWNSAIGCNIFLPPEQICTTSDVIVELGVVRTNPYTGARIDGEAWFNSTQRVSYVKLNTPGTTTWDYLIFMHELGHVLGLDHDRWRLSVMRPGGHVPRRRMGIDRGPPWPIVSHQDRKLVRDRFCR